MMDWSPRCYIPSFVEIGLPVLEKISKGVLPYIGMATILVMCPASCNQIFISLYLKVSYKIWFRSAKWFLRKSSLKFCMYTTLTLTFNTHVSSYVQLDVCSYQLSGHCSSFCKSTVFTFSYRKALVTKFDLAVK